MYRNRAIFDSFRCAISGLAYVLSSQRNMRIHSASAGAAVILGIVLRLDSSQMAILVLTICMVLTAEALNTAIEAVVDLATQEYRELARVAKNVAAGAVLLCAIGSLAVAGLLFIPRIVELL